MMRVLILVNLARGLIALIASSATAMPSPVTFPTRTTYILGTFQVNALHGLMHLAMGAFGLLVFRHLESSYLIGHTVWFLLIGSCGLYALPGLAPHHRRSDELQNNNPRDNQHETEQAERLGGLLEQVHPDDRCPGSPDAIPYGVLSPHRDPP